MVTWGHHCPLPVINQAAFLAAVTFSRPLLSADAPGAATAPHGERTVHAQAAHGDPRDGDAASGLERPPADRILRSPSAATTALSDREKLLFYAYFKQVREGGRLMCLKITCNRDVTLLSPLPLRHFPSGHCGRLPGARR